MKPCKLINLDGTEENMAVEWNPESPAAILIREGRGYYRIGSEQRGEVEVFAECVTVHSDTVL